MLGSFNREEIPTNARWSTSAVTETAPHLTSNPYPKQDSSGEETTARRGTSRRDEVLCAMWKTDPAPHQALRKVVSQVQSDENVITWLRQTPNFLDMHVKSLRGAEGAQKLKRYALWEAMREAARNVPRTFLQLFHPLAPAARA